MSDTNQDINFIDENERRLFADVDFHCKCVDFLRSEIGRYLEGCAVQDIKDCAIELLDVDASDADAIRKIQTKAGSARNFLAWLNEAIAIGENSGQLLETYRD
jgi:hypothetical protein